MVPGSSRGKPALLPRAFFGLLGRHRPALSSPLAFAGSHWLLSLLQSFLSGLDAEAQLHLPTDFHAFYCRAVVARSGGSPYLALPLATCEQHLVSVSAASETVSLITAPLSGYFLAFLVPLTALSPTAAAAVWTVLVAAFIVMVWALNRLTGVPIVTVTLAILVLGLLVPMATGQPTAIWLS